jgi:hypothetical protein
MGAVDALPGQNKFDNAFSAFNPSQYNMLADPMAEYIKKQNEAAGVPSPQPTSSVNAQASVPPASAASPTASTPLPQPRPLTAGDNTYTFGGVQVPVFGQPTPSPFSGAGFGAGDAFGSPANMGQGATIDNSALMKAILGMF